MKAHIEEGTLIRATFRSEDLLPAFYDELKRVAPEKAAAILDDHALAEDDSDTFWADDGSPWWEVNAEPIGELINDLHDALDEAAPRHLRFGAHEGDGSDFGYWTFEDEEPGSVLTPRQEKRLGPVRWTDSEGVSTWWVVCTVSFDDRRGNGHNTLHVRVNGFASEDRAQTARGEFDCHGDWPGMDKKHILRVFPEVKDLLKWNGMNSNGPMHYPANALYFARDRDCWGLRKGEQRQIRNGKTGLPCWTLEPTAELPDKYVDAETCPPAPVIEMVYVPRMKVGEGKEPELETARRSAYWPDATLEQLQDEQVLRERLPDLIAAFRADIEAFGMTF